MKQFKLGDKVHFLNERGGGIITRIISEEIVHVAVEEGFDIPYSVKDLLKVGSINADYHTSPHLHRAESEPTGITSLYDTPNLPGSRPEGAYLALTPSDQNDLQKGNVTISLINHSKYDLLFAVYINQSGTYSGSESGFIEPGSALLLAEVARNQLENWANGLVQLIFYREGKATPLLPASAVIAFKPVALYSDGVFLFESLIRKKSLFVPLASIEKQARNLSEPNISPEALKGVQEKMSHDLPRQKSEGAQQAKPEKSFLDKHKVDDRIAEVDLHIGELFDDYSKMSNADMVRAQMDYVRRCMEQARLDAMAKIIFIHGVGNGTLKNELLRYLRHSEGIDFYDASYARYGQGATEVAFYRNG